MSKRKGTNAKRRIVKDGLVTIYLNTKDSPEGDWEPKELRVPQIPAVGEIVVLGWQTTWYEVRLVAHCPYEGADSAAEVWAIAVDDKEILGAVSGGKWPRRTAK